MVLVGTCCVLLPAQVVLSQEVEAADQAQQQEAPSQAAAAKFDLFELRVKGNSMLDKKRLERTLYPFLGPNKSVDVVESARAALEKLYIAEGYQTVSVDIPEQSVKSGIVYLQVVEGKVSQLRVTDSRYYSQGEIKAKVPELAEGNVPNMPKMQAQLAELAAQSQDRSVVPILRAGETPGTLEVDLKVNDTLPLHAKVELNSYNSIDTSRLRALVSLHYDNLWQKFHSASFMYQTSPEAPNEVEVFVGTYMLPVFDDKRLVFYGVSSSSNIATAGAFNVVGNGNIYGSRFVWPMPSSENYSQNATFGVDYKDFGEDLAPLGSDTSTKTPISYLPFTVQYGGNLRDADSLLTFDAGINFAIRGLVSDQSQFDDKRYLSQSNFIYLTSGLAYKRNLPWGMEFTGRMAGQLANSPLISNEQFAIGGHKSVRGYYEAQVLADHGVSGSMELFTPHLAPAEWEEIDSLRALFFIDGGGGWIMDALPGSPQNMALAGIGAGLRIEMLKHLQGEFDFASPLLEQGNVRVGENRIDFRFMAQF
ncbi:ShlB/FhaC/HecB family hemolysin secretion/activation protein [Methylomonas lenta]|nr:ShlB/FhaC/HecB family hemolysin secretion/activation protein [Methylomonas lenta]